MSLSYADACDQVTAPGQPFALVDAEIRGRTYPVFENAPPSLANLFAMAALRGDQTYVVYEDEEWSFGEIVAHGHALAAALVDDLGIEKGDRVAIAMRNHPEYITAVIGIMSAGAVAVPLNAWWTGDELAYGLTDSGSRAVVCDPERLERLAGLANGPDVATILVRDSSDAASDGAAADGAASDGAVADHRYDDLVESRRPAPEVEIGPEDDATILYTSGTTGNPKGAVATHRAHTNAVMGYWARATVAAAIAAAEPDEPEGSGTEDLVSEAGSQSFILTVPLFHVTGFVPVMLGSFGLGTKLVMMYRWDAKRALELIEREQVTMFVGVPTMLQDLLECPEFDDFDTSSLRSIGGGGAAAAPELVRRVEGSFAKGRPGIGYGMTETTAYGPQNVGDDYLAKPTSSGKAVPVMQIKVIDEQGNTLGPDETGEICFYGPTLIREYWNKPEATAEAFIDGWLRTGDIGRIDADGDVFIEDRAKDLVIRAGENIGCIEVEAAIVEHPSVYEVAVFGLPHERLGEELACCIHLKEGETLDAETLRAHVAERLAGFKVPSVVEFSAEMLPRSAQGKILKREIRDRLTEERAAAT